jgi:uncharacterized protein YkwD
VPVSRKAPQGLLLATAFGLACGAPFSCPQESRAASGTGQGDLLTLDQARHFMLGLINRDRASAGCEPVTLDEIGNKAGNLHTDEMAQYGYLSHWTKDGRKPDVRYTDVGGRDTVAENADSTDVEKPVKVELSKNQLFSKRDLEEIEGQFFNEKAPNDGHRVNILMKDHNRVGIGISLAGGEPGGDDLPRLALTEEFINHYGEYGELPASLAAGESFTLEGTLEKGAHLQSVDVRWEKAPTPMTITELLATNSYSIPGTAQFNFFPPPFISAAPINLSDKNGCEHFALTVQTNGEWRPGVYYICLWATLDGHKEPTLVSTRTINYGGTGK